MSPPYLYFYRVIAVEVDGSHAGHVEGVCAVQQHEQPEQRVPRPFLQQGETLKYN